MRIRSAKDRASKWARMGTEDCAELVRGCGTRVREKILKCGDVAAEEGARDDLLGGLSGRCGKMRRWGSGRLRCRWAVVEASNKSDIS